METTCLMVAFSTLKYSPDAETGPLGGVLCSASCACTLRRGKRILSAGEDISQIHHQTPIAKKRWLEIDRASMQDIHANPYICVSTHLADYFKLVIDGASIHAAHAAVGDEPVVIGSLHADSLSGAERNDGRGSIGRNHQS